MSKKALKTLVTHIFYEVMRNKSKLEFNNAYFDILDQKTFLNQHKSIFPSYFANISSNNHLKYK